MIMEIYSVRDKAVEAFLQPFFSPTLASAMRSLGVVVNDPNHEFAKHVKDYSLYRLGTFDDSNGVLTHDPEPVHITPLSSLLKSE